MTQETLPPIGGRDRKDFSVVIPAHNEERRLPLCLAKLRTVLDRCEVVVVANGCTDKTAEVARQFRGVRVVEIDEPSKIAALNAGDDAVTAFPRIYLDADIEMEAAVATELARTLREANGPVVGAPHVRFDTEQASRAVRAFYDVYRRLPYVRDGLIGLGVYGLSEAGRARFQDFPRVTADDLFVQRLFSHEERRISDGVFVVSVPRDLRNLRRVRTRAAAGSQELAAVPDDSFRRSTTDTGRGLLVLLRERPAKAPAIGLYVVLTLVTRISARWSRGGAWARDTSTR